MVAVVKMLLVVGLFSVVDLFAAETGKQHGEETSSAAKPRREVLRPDAANVRYAPKRPELTVRDPASDRLLDVYLPRTPKPPPAIPA